MKIYLGTRTKDGAAAVSVTDDRGPPRELPLRLDLDNHSPTGFEWGYGGSGPAQLALALLADVLGDEHAAVVLHQQFKWKFISTIPQHASWRMTEHEVRDKANLVKREMQNYDFRYDLLRGKL